MIQLWYLHKITFPPTKQDIWKKQLKTGKSEKNQVIICEAKQQQVTPFKYILNGEFTSLLLHIKQNV